MFSVLNKMLSKYMKIHTKKSVKNKINWALGFNEPRQTEEAEISAKYKNRLSVSLDFPTNLYRS